MWLAGTEGRTLCGRSQGGRSVAGHRPRAAVGVAEGPRVRLTCRAAPSWWTGQGWQLPGGLALGQSSPSLWQVVSYCTAHTPPFCFADLRTNIPYHPSPAWDHKLLGAALCRLGTLKATESKFFLSRYHGCSPWGVRPSRGQVCRGQPCVQAAAGGQQHGSAWSAVRHPNSKSRKAAATSHCSCRLHLLGAQMPALSHHGWRR